MANYLSAYQMRRPQQNLKAGLEGLGMPTISETRLQKAIGLESLQELLGVWYGSEKRATKNKPVTDTLNVISMLTDPITSGIIGAVSGTIEGYDEKRAYDKLISKLKRLTGTQKGYKKATFEEHLAEAGSKKVGTGDIALKAGTKALSNFAIGTIADSLGGIEKGKDIIKGEELVEGGKSLTESLTDAPKFKTDFGFDLKTTKPITQYTPPNIKPSSGNVNFTQSPKGIIDYSKTLAITPSGGKINFPKTNIPSFSGNQDFTSIIKDASTRTEPVSLAQSITPTDSYKPELASWIKNLQEGKALDLKDLDLMDWVGIMPMFQQAIGSMFTDPGEKFRI